MDGLQEQIRIQAEIDQEEALEGPGNYVTVDPQTLGEALHLCVPDTPGMDT